MSAATELALLLGECIAQREELRELNAELLAALKVSVIALDDWLNLYAFDLCDEKRVAEARCRIATAGGTVAYIADLQKLNREAIAKAEKLK